jgi:predicted RNase H-like nuclease (RuvC/YqgF family)
MRLLAMRSTPKIQTSPRTMNETINSQTLVTCQHCGKATNIADEPAYRNLVHLNKANRAIQACNDDDIEQLKETCTALREENNKLKSKIDESNDIAKIETMRGLRRERSESHQQDIAENCKQAERLEGDVKRLRDALLPFALYSDAVKGDHHLLTDCVTSIGDQSLSVFAFRNAKQALAETECAK